MILLDTETMTAIDTEKGNIFHNKNTLGECVIRKWPPISLSDKGLLESWAIFTGQPAKDLADLLVKYTGSCPVYITKYYEQKKSDQKVDPGNYSVQDMNKALAVKRLEVMRLLYNKNIKPRLDSSSADIRDLFEAYNYPFKKISAKIAYKYTDVDKYLTDFYTPLAPDMAKKLKETGKIINKFGRTLINNNITCNKIEDFLVNWQVETTQNDLLQICAWHFDNALFGNGGGAFIHELELIAVGFGARSGDQRYIDTVDAFFKDPFGKFPGGLSYEKVEVNIGQENP